MNAVVIPGLNSHNLPLNMEYVTDIRTQVSEPNTRINLILLSGEVLVRTREYNDPSRDGVLRNYTYTYVQITPLESGVKCNLLRPVPLTTAGSFISITTLFGTRTGLGTFFDARVFRSNKSRIQKPREPSGNRATHRLARLNTKSRIQNLGSKTSDPKPR